MASKLLIRPIPFEGESFYSWLSRVCSANSSRGKRRVLEMAGLLGSNKRIKPNPKLTKSNVADLSKLTGVDEASIHGLLWLNIERGNEGSIFSRQFLYNQRSRICPSCLAETGHWKKAWQLLPVTCCTKHFVRLTTSCRCGRPIEVYPYSILRCECGRNLSSQKSVRASSGEVELCRYVLGGDENKVDAALVNRLYEIQFCLWFWYQSVKGHDENLIRSWGNRRVISGCKYVGTLIANGAIDIEPLMRRYVESQRRSDVRFRSVLGDCHDYVKRIVYSGYTGDFYNQLAIFEESGWYGSKLLCRSRYGASSLLKTIKEVARDYESKPTHIKRIVEYEALDLVQNGGRIRLVDASDDGHLKESLGAWLSLDQAALFMGISKNSVQQLAEAKLLDGRKSLLQRDWLVLKASCSSLEQKLKQRASSDLINCVPLRSLQLFPYKVFSKVIYDCLKGGIAYKFHSNDDPICNLLVDRQYLQTLESIEKKELRSAREASEFLNINLNALYYLITKRYITTSSRYCRNRKVYGFSDENIDNFRDRYCFYTEAKDFLLSRAREDLMPSLRAVNIGCTHRSRIRLYKWQHVRALLSRLKPHRKPSLLYDLSAAAQFAGVTINKLRSLTRAEWIIPYKPPSHHDKLSSIFQYTAADLNRLRVLLENYPELMPLRAASKQLGYDRSHVRKQFVLSGYLHSTSVPECPAQIFCYKKEVFALKRLIARTVTGPQLAKFFGVTRNTVYKWMRSGKLIPVISPSNEGFASYRYVMPNQRLKSYLFNQ